MKRLGLIGQAAICFWIIAAGQAIAGGAAAVQTHSPFPSNGFEFTGTWKCDGTFRGGTIHRSTFEGRKAVGDTWLQLDEVDHQPATGYLARYLIGYDAHKHRFVEFDASNSAAGTYSNDEGWVGQSLTLVSEPLKDPSVPYTRDRFVYTVNASGGFAVDWQVIKPGAAEWLEGDHLDCVRSS